MEHNLSFFLNIHHTVAAGSRRYEYVDVDYKCTRSRIYCLLLNYSVKTIICEEIYVKVRGKKKKYD